MRAAPLGDRARGGWLWFAGAHRLQAVLGAAISAALFVGGVALVFGGEDWRSGPPPVPSESARSAELAAAPVLPSSGRSSSSRSSVLPVLGKSVPRTLDIPAIGVRTSLMTLGLQKDGTIAVPPLGKDAPAGWYRYLSSPGEPGPAVILGHVDSAREGPAVFYRLGDLEPGDRLSITRADGWVTTFTVRRVGVYDKTEFPSDEVYGSVPEAEVRLVTCGGPFDRSKGHYRDNIVVFATLTAAHPPA